MSFTADAWVSSDGKATIRLWSEEPWTDSAWSLQGRAKDLPTARYISLYSLWRQSGNGAIGGSWLTITIENCPEGDFLLSTQHVVKIFKLSEGQMTFGSGLVGLNNHAPPRAYEASSSLIVKTLPKQLVYFGGDLRPYRGRVTAQLQKDGKLQAILAGNEVDYIESGFDGWAIPALVFTDFYWLQKPTTRTSYKLVLREQKRSGAGGLMSFTVEMDSNKIYSPLMHPAYEIESDHEFSMAMGTGLEVREQ